MGFQVLSGVAMAHAQEQHIRLAGGQGGEGQCCLSEQVLVHAVDGLSCLAIAEGKGDVDGGMV